MKVASSSGVGDSERTGQCDGERSGCSGLTTEEGSVKAILTSLQSCSVLGRGKACSQQKT